MGDYGLSDHPQPMEILDLYLGDNLQPHPGECPRETCGHQDLPEPCGEQTWATEPPESTRQDAPPWGSDVELTHLGSCSAQGEHRQNTASPGSPGLPGNSHLLGSPQQNRSTSTQVVFWAGILQAQMCVLDLEEELEKTEGLKAGLRCCLPSPAVDLPRDMGLHSSPPEEEDSGEDSSEPEGEGQAWLREGIPDSSPQWGAEEDSMFFSNPLFLESPCSENSASGERFSWGASDCHAGVRTGPESPATLEPPVPGDTVLWEMGSEPDLEDSAVTSGHRTPPFPVPIYKPHSICWASVAAAEGAPAALPAQGESERDQLGPAPSAAPCVDEALTWESGCIGSDLGPAACPVQPWGPWEHLCLSQQALPSPEGWQRAGPFWPQVPLNSQDRGDGEAGHFQESGPCALAPSPSRSPASSPEPSSPESESRGPGPRPSPASSQEGSPQLQHHSPGILPKWTLDASHSSLLETDGEEPSSLKKEEAREAPNPGEEVKSEETVQLAETENVQPDIHLTSAEQLPVSPMPQAWYPEEGQRPPAGDRLSNGIRNKEVAWNLASRLYRLEGFRKSEVAAYLQKNNDFSRAVAEEYLSFFQFGGQSLDRALRGFLQALVLSGETQERERILYQFSRRFHHCNPGIFPSVDSVHTLTCAIMLLNTDLHGQNIGKSMSCQEFITNLNGLRDGGNFPKQLLKALYWSIRSEKLEWAVDEEDAAKPEKARLSLPTGKMTNPFLQLAQDPTVPTYKQGILARKMHHDADGKKTPWGKRGWKMFHTLLRGMVLYFLKGEDHCLEGESLMGQMVDEPVGVHHSLATPATHYTKKPHVFQLRTADWRLYLFQAPTAKEMSSWIARINLAAATHSAPPFPAAVGSQRRFVRPILPVGPAQSSLEEQHRSHENCLDAASDDLLDLQRNLPERRGRSRELEEYRLRKEYLEYEKTRYETYVQLLVARLHCPSDALDLWEEQLGREAGGTREPKFSLKKSHSSPSLHQDEAPTTAKVKRNISERRTYRKIIPKRNRNQL
nr:PH and SEC7 domain-containing protein 4 isoform X1 [Aotus nancymaae]XP_012294384.1 PH and SEC7 domain-containing protein 4 isoform X1 [Aotus nancymaae]XP_012294385.1 PH and SEC7 domain-containing protein 4 isoform X1 [Aotus nancymaae]XP_012294386.1 PH and SEC7 domain-containing protein 4 isoform X1 [Aotus nancymaae]